MPDVHVAMIPCSIAVPASTVGAGHLASWFTTSLGGLDLGS